MAISFLDNRRLAFERRHIPVGDLFFTSFSNPSLDSSECIIKFSVSDSP